ncbi:MAG TPA: tetratricopeptide repeat protein [Rhizomicrobium sp.]|jgi:tetratricopeptide (TPR) repeat protein
MIDRREPQPERTRLHGWKEIATFLARDQRTVRRWESTRGLPVRRVPGDGQPSVFAYSEELSAWLNSSRGATGESNSGRKTPRDGVKRHATPWFRMAAVPAPILWAMSLLLVAGLISSVQHFQGAAANPVDVRSPSPVATELYRSGLHEWQSRTPSGLKRAIDDLKAAITHDPNFAPAYAELAAAYDVEHEFSKDTSDRLYPLAIQAAGRAIVLNADLAKAHAALGFAKFYGARQTDVALAEFSSAISLDPNNALAHHWYATTLLALGNFRKAAREIELARALDPESIAIPADRALILFHAGQTEEAYRELSQLETDNPLFASAHLYLSDIALARGDYRHYLREAALFSNASHDEVGEAVARAGMKGFAAGGKFGMLRALLAQQRKFFQTNKVSAFQMARTYALLGDGENAFALLAVSVQKHEPDNIALKIDSAFAELQNDARMSRLERMSGLVRGRSETLRS